MAEVINVLQKKLKFSLNKAAYALVYELMLEDDVVRRRINAVLDQFRQ